jgi:glucose/arabinose dehydrogenase
MFAFGKILAIPLAAFLASTAFIVPASTAETKIGKAAFGDWKDDQPGARRHIRASDLPPAKLRKDVVANFPGEAEKPADAKPQVPEGFTVEMVATGIESPRAMRFAPNGDLFVADSKANQVRVYRMKTGSAKPEKDEIFATGLYQPYGIAFYPPGPEPKWIYIANSRSVIRFPYKNGDMKATGESEDIIGYIPAAHHWTRDIVFSPEGDKLYVAVGSGSNVALDMCSPSKEWKNSTKPILSALPGTPKSAAPMFSLSIPRARTRRYLPRVCAIAQE